MRWTSAIAIYFLIWVLCAFLVMPFGIKTPDETGDTVGDGHAPSAPVNFNPKRILLRTTIVATALFALFYLNYRFGWITLGQITFVRPPASSR